MKSWPKVKLGRWSQFEHCSKSLVYPKGSHIIGPSLSNIKLDQVYSYQNLVLYILMCGPNISLCPCWALFILIYPLQYLTLFIIIYLYLVIFTFNCHDFTTCVIVTLHRYSSIETIIDIAFQIIGRYRKYRHKYSLHLYLVNDNFVCVGLVGCTVKTVSDTVSDTLPLYQIWKLSNNYL